MKTLLRLAALVLWLPLGSAQAAQMPRASAAQRNDVYLPSATEALAALGRGDHELLLAQKPGPASAGHWALAFEEWHKALTSSVPGDAVPVGLSLGELERSQPFVQDQLQARWPDRDRSFARRTEAIEYAVLRRLSGLDAVPLAAWQARFGALAETRLAGLLGNAALPLGTRRLGLAALERELPATSGALRADLWLFEDTLEQGRPRAARVWLERAERQAGLLADGRWGAALATRRPWLESLTPPLQTRRPRWSTALEFVPVSGHPLSMPGHWKPESLAPLEGQPGIAFLADGRVLVQTSGTCWLLAPDKKDRIFEPWRLAKQWGQPIARTVERTGRDWPLYPLSEGDGLFLVTGRADGQSSNLLQRIRPPKKIELPVAVWSLGGAGLFHEDGSHQRLEDVLGPGMWEFQPGPLLIEGTLLVQARQWITNEVLGEERAVSAGEAKAWLLALDASSGRPLWRRFLCRGTELAEDFGSRFARTRLIRTPAAPLRASATMVLVGTNLGAGCLLELADGRLVTSFANDRRKAAEPGWRDVGRPVAWEQPGEVHPVLLWAPADASELYALRAAVDFGPRGGPPPPVLLAQPPLALGESEALLGGSAQQALVFGRAGARRTLSAHNLEAGSRIDSIYFGRDERSLLGALISETRVLFATDAGLYRLDRTRELYLDLFQPLRMESAFAAGGLWARGNDVYLLAKGQLFHYVLP